jgi:hypothetical protein
MNILGDQMNNFPESEDPFLIRTDFSDDSKWEILVSLIEKPTRIESETTFFKDLGSTDIIEEYKANVTFVNAPIFKGMSIHELVTMYPLERNHMCFFVADTKTLRHPDFPIIVVDLSEKVGRTFRVIPSEMWSVENNLSICNMDFEEFSGSIDSDGIFRGFPEI